MSRRARIRPLPGGEGTESALIDGLREGRDGAFEALYHGYAERVHRLAIRYLGDEDLARNALQETFLRVFRKIHTFRGDSGLGTWIYRIAANVCLNEIRKPDRRRILLAEGTDALEDPADPERPLDEQVSRAQLVDRVGDLLAELEPKKRITFLMFYVEDLTADEIAEVLGEGRGTVLKRLQRTRQEIVDMAARAGLTDRTMQDARDKEA